VLVWCACVWRFIDLSKCDFCKSDSRCHSNTDPAYLTPGGCAGGWAADAASCRAPAATPYCDGEVTTCQQCASKSEFFFEKCNWCPDDGKCWGLADFSAKCKSATIDECSANTVDPNFKFECSQCNRCNSDCQQTFSNGMTFCLRGELQIVAGQCKTDKSAADCCAPGSTPAPPASNGPLRPALSSICPEFSAGCGSALDFCSYKARYLSCATGSDRCSDFSVLATQYDAKCPAIMCQCSAVPQPCLPGGERVSVTCSVAGAAIVDNCAACKDCSCEQRCCQTKCAAMDGGKVVEPFKCEMNNGATRPECKCAKGNDATSLQTATMGALGAAAAMLVV
jgi:hypothetical protein